MNRFYEVLAYVLLKSEKGFVNQVEFCKVAHKLSLVFPLTWITK